MIEIPHSALLLAGFALAHAAWSVSDTKPTELLVPLAVVEHDGQRRVERFEAATQLEAIAAGKSATVKLTAASDTWAFAREGAMRQLPNGSSTHDVISVDFWTRGMASPVTLVQAFERADSGHGFRVVGAPWISIDGKQIEGPEAEPYIAAVVEGVLSHAKVAPLWPTWK